MTTLAMEKRCNKCKEDLHISNFNMKNIKKNKRDSYCKQCRSEISKANREKAKVKKEQEKEKSKQKRIELGNKVREVKKTYGSLEEYFKEKRAEIEKHQCHECIWGRWISTAKKYVCMFPSCQNDIEQLRKVQ